jgi:hydroxymethylpyrimidine/phosphomethylpyrimidine kinase
MNDKKLSANLSSSSEDSLSPDAPPICLTVAGLDPSGGAGVIADIKTFTAFGCFATAVVSSVTFQNTAGVFGARHLSAAEVEAQILPLIEDYKIAAVKTGMLPTRAVIEAVARLIREGKLPAPVVDPVMRSTSGYDLIDRDAVEALKFELLPLARLITPNIPEAVQLTGLEISDEQAMRRAARALREMGARAVLIKGGHLQLARNIGSDARQTVELFADENDKENSKVEDFAVDLLDEGETVRVFRAPFIEARGAHGTGCALASAVAAGLAHGLELDAAVARAKIFVTEAIRRALPIGRGNSPINPAIPVQV